MAIYSYLRLLRPQQWLKNGFVFAGLIFAHAWHETALILQVFLAAIAFCLVSSAVYIINDFFDFAADQTHPIKRRRPLTSRQVKPVAALLLAGLLTGGGLLLGFFVSLWTGWILLTYIGLNWLYSLYLKQVVILDVFVISAGFLLRILAGTSGIGIPPSVWLLLCSLMLTLFLGFNKRRSEFFYMSQSPGLISQPVLTSYNEALLDKLIVICATGAILTYIFYTLNQDNLLNPGEHRFIYTVPLVVYGIFRYLYLADNRRYMAKQLDIATSVLSDPQLFIVVSVWLILLIALGV